MSFLHPNKLALWDIIEDNYRDSTDFRFFELSIGIEFETTDLSFTKNFERVLTLLEKHTFMDPKYQIYGDSLTKDQSIRKKIQKFKKQSSVDPYVLKFGQEQIEIQENVLSPNEIFNDAEIIITYPDPRKIIHNQVFHYIFSQFCNFTNDLEFFLQSFSGPFAIKNKDFPYDYVYQYENFYLLKIGHLTLEQINFVPQITIGVELDKATKFLDILYELWYFESGQICPILTKTQYIVERVFMNHSNWEKMKNYFFLFSYSYFTRQNRKSQMFLFRNLFSVLGQAYLGDHGIEILFGLLDKQKSYDDDIRNLYFYFKRVHKMIPHHYPSLKHLQYMQYSTTFTSTDRFFIEIRGFNNIILDIFELMGEKKMFSIQNFRQHSEEFEIIFFENIREKQYT